MSDEQRKDEETEVEAHSKKGANDEPTSEDGNDEFEAHVHKTANVRMDSPSNT